MLFVDFEIEESHINDDTDGEFVETPPRESHAHARPHECADCHRNTVHVDRHIDHHDDYNRVDRHIDLDNDYRPAPARPISIPTRTYEGPRAAPIVVPADIPQGNEVIWGDSRPY